MKQVILFLCTALMLAACVRQEGLKTLDLSASSGIDFYTDPLMPSVAELDGTPVHDLLLSDPRIWDVWDDCYVLQNDKVFYFVNRETGAAEGGIDHVGRGPGEYIFPINYSRLGSVVAITDNLNGKVILYNRAGEWIGQREIPSSSMFYFWKENGSVVTYSSTSDHDLDFYEGDERIDSVDVASGPDKTGSVFMTNLDLFNGQYFFKPTIGDTMYRVTDEAKLVPYLILDKGNLRMPEAYYTKMSDWYAHSDDYITLEYARIAGDYAFVEYNFHEHMVRELWHLPTEKMLFKTTPQTSLMELGFPVEFNGETIPFWPTYVNGKDAYAVWGEEDPVILRLRLSD